MALSQNDHGIKKEVVRRSARLEALRSGKQSTPTSSFVQEIQILPSNLHTSNVPVDGKALHSPPVLQNPAKPHQKRKRGHEAGTFPQVQDRSPSKRPQNSPSSCTSEERVPNDICEANTDPITFWSCTGTWPKKHFGQDSQVIEDFETGKTPQAMDPFQPLHYLRGKTSTYLGSTKSGTISSSLPRAFKSSPYTNLKYEKDLEEMGSHMHESEEGCERELFEKLLCFDRTVPQGSKHSSIPFNRIWHKVRGRNEASIVKHITPMIVPSAWTLESEGADYLDQLEEATDEGWNSSIPFLGPRPQPDYSVGFSWSAFTQEQLKKLRPFTGHHLSETGIKTLFMATSEMYFPFLTCEVECGAGALNVADRQNAHSMTLSVRGTVELYGAVNRKHELHREILGLSISHDDAYVRIYGHYPIITGDKTTIYRYDISDTPLQGREKWRPYKFIKNVYDVWRPIHHKRICSAIDDLPPVDSDYSDVSHTVSFSQPVSEILRLKNQVTDQMAETRRLHSEQITGLEKQMAEQEKRQIEQEKRHHIEQEKRHIEQEKRHIEQEKRHNEQMDMFRQRLGLVEDKEQSVRGEGRSSARRYYEPLLSDRMESGGRDGTRWRIHR